MRSLASDILRGIRVWLALVGAAGLLAGAPAASPAQTTTAPATTSPQAAPPPAPEDDPSAYAYVESVPTSSGPVKAEPKRRETQHSGGGSTNTGSASSPAPARQPAAPVTQLPATGGVVRSKPKKRHHRKARAHARKQHPASKPAPTEPRLTIPAASRSTDAGDGSLLALVLALIAVTGGMLAMAHRARRRASV